MCVCVFETVCETERECKCECAVFCEGNSANMPASIDPNWIPVEDLKDDIAAEQQCSRAQHFAQTSRNSKYRPRKNSKT